MPTPQAIEEAMGEQRSGNGQAALSARAVRHRMGEAARRRRRGQRSRRRHDPHPQLAVAVREQRCRRARRAAVSGRGQPSGADRAARADDAELDRLEADGVLSSRLPRSMTLHYPVPPMKAQLSVLPADDENWAYEIKWDGYRTLCFVEGGRCAMAEQQPDRRDREVSGARRLRRLASTPARRSSTASSSCSTARAGRRSS